MRWWYRLVAPELLENHDEVLAMAQRKHEQVLNQGQLITALQDKHDKLLNDLKRERKCVDEYARHDSWYYHDGNAYKGVYVHPNDCEWSEDYQRLIGGKSARATVNLREVKL